MVDKNELQERIVELETQLAGAEVLKRLATELSTARDAQELLCIIAQPAIAAGANEATLSYTEPAETGEPEWIEKVADWRRTGESITPLGMRYRLTDFPLARVLLTTPDAPLLISDINHSDEIDENSRQVLSNLGARAMVVIPLTQAARWVGFITIFWDERHEFTAQETAYYRALPTLATSMIENRRLIDRLAQQVKEHTALLADLNIFKALADNTSDYVAYVDVQDTTGRLAYVNPAGLAMVGRGGEDPRSLRIADTHPPEIGQKVQEEYLPSALEKGVWTGETKLLHADGSCIDVSQVIIPIRDESGEFRFLATIMRDISERKRLTDNLEQMVAERTAKLRESEENYRRITTNMQDIVAQLSPEGIFEYTSPSYKTMLGYEPETLLGQSALEFIHPDDLDAPLGALQDIMKNGASVRAEFRYKCADGSYLWMESVGNPVYDDQGQIIGAIVNSRDITERKRADAERERMVSIIENSADFIGTAAPDGRGTFVNPAGLAMSGYIAEEFYGGMTVASLQPDLPQEILDTAVREGIWAGEATITHKDGHQIPVSQVIVAIKDEAGNLQSLATIARDITAQKEAEAERARLQQQILDAQQQIISELSTPIIPIMEQIIVMPLIGIIDTMRARDITRTLLAGISEHRARVVILDITGVPIVDSGIAAHLDKTIQAARLKGARVIITGISDAVAEAIVDLGIDWSSIETLRDLQTGLVVALNRMGVELARNA